MRQRRGGSHDCLRTRGARLAIRFTVLVAAGRHCRPKAGCGTGLFTVGDAILIILNYYDNNPFCQQLAEESMVLRRLL